MKEEVKNEQELFTDEEIVKVMEAFDEAVAMDGIDCIIYSVTTREGKIRSHVRGMKFNVMLALLSVIEGNDITIKELEKFQLIREIMKK
jgi:hypothetical protein